VGDHATGGDEHGNVVGDAHAAHPQVADLARESDGMPDDGGGAVMVGGNRLDGDDVIEHGVGGKQSLHREIASGQAGGVSFAEMRRLQPVVDFAGLDV